MEFESIGDNCEFGLMQRTVGTERMGLGSYAGVYDVADDAHLHGTVIWLRDRLFRGYISSLAPYTNAHATEEQAWLDLLANARRALARTVASHRSVPAVSVPA